MLVKILATWMGHSHQLSVYHYVNNIDLLYWIAALIIFIFFYSMVPSELVVLL